MSYLNDWWRVFFGGMEYPYTDSCRYNDDWLLEVVKKLVEEFANFVNLNKIKYADPIGWDITRQYETNTVVVDNRTGNAYISSRPVPAGVQISNTTYWTEIYNYANVIDTLREQIAFNEGDTTTASKTFEVGELVFVNGLLYRVIAPMIAGDSFVLDSNVEKTTIEKEIKRAITSIAAETLARQEADELLQDNIDNEALARQEADEALQQNIDNEILEREKISHIVYTSNYDNFSDIITALTDDSILCLNSAVNITGVTGVINAPIICTADGVFTGTPTSFTINNQVILPRWFGVKKADSAFNNAPAIQKAINACPRGGKVYLEKGEYYVSTPIVINKVITFSGDRDGTYLTAGFSSLDTIVTISGSGSTYVDGATIENMMLGRYANLNNSTALYITRAANTLIRNLRLINCNYGIKYKFTTSTRTEGCISLTALEQAQFFGYLLDCTEDAPLAGTSANGSCYFINCAVNVSSQPTGTCEGFYATGKDIRDLYFIQCETALTKNGINLDANSGAMATDINITNCVLDRCLNHGIRIKNIQALDGGVKISNTFISLDPSATPEQGIVIDTCWNVYANNVEVYCNATGATGLYIRASHGCVINNTLFNACGFAIVTESNSLNTYSNIVCRAQTQQATGILFADSKSVLNNIAFSAYTTGVSITGSANIVVGLTRSTNVTDTYVDSGANNQIGYYV